MSSRIRSAAGDRRTVRGLSSFFLSRMTSLQKKPPTFWSCRRCRPQSFVLELLTIAAVDPAGVVETHAGIMQTEVSHVNAGDTIKRKAPPASSTGALG